MVSTHRRSAPSYSPIQRRILEFVRGSWPAYIAGLLGVLGWWSVAALYWFYVPPDSGRASPGGGLVAFMLASMLAFGSALFSGWALCSYRPLRRIQTGLVLIGISHALYCFGWLLWNVDT
jgi:hypothetical protein